MRDDNIFDGAVNRAVKKMVGIQEQLDRRFPTNDLTRRQWKEINQRGEDAIPEFTNLANPDTGYGRWRVEQWVRRNQQRDLEERA